MPKTNLLDIVDVLETYADLYDMFDDNRLVYEALDKVNEELRAIPYVNAIPIEWIRNNWLKRNDYQGTIEFFPQPTFEDVMNWLIEDWEKENGRD